MANANNMQNLPGSGIVADTSMFSKLQNDDSSVSPNPLCSEESVREVSFRQNGLNMESKSEFVSSDVKLVTEIFVCPVVLRPIRTETEDPGVA